MKHTLTLALSAALSLVVSANAFADKATREYKKSDVDPAVKEAETKFKAACGCPLTITVAANTIDTQDNLYQVKHIANSISEGAAGYCTDAESKKAVCQMTSLEIQRGKEASFTFKGSKGLAVHDGQSYYPFESMAKQLDK